MHRKIGCSITLLSDVPKRITLPGETILAQLAGLFGLEAYPAAFPSGRYDDQVDALLLFLDWFPRATQPTFEMSGMRGKTFVEIEIN